MAPIDRLEELKRLVEDELADRLGYDEFRDDFLQLWKNHGRNYRQRGLTDEMIIAALRKTGEALLTMDDEIEWLDLPESPIELYRGSSRARPFGLSWTTHLDVASAFALVAGDTGALVTASVPPSAILGAIEREQEDGPPYYEYLVDTSELEATSIIPNSNHRVLTAALRDIDRRLESNRYPSERMHILRWRRTALEIRDGAA